jgi:hypothetical protein
MCVCPFAPAFGLAARNDRCLGGLDVKTVKEA